MTLIPVTEEIIKCTERTGIVLINKEETLEYKKLREYCKDCKFME